MPDREKVIQGLFDAIGIIHGYIPKRYWGDGEQACRDAITLLKEQEAKQIVRKQCKKEYEDGSIDYFAEWYCPHCKLLILRGFDNPSIKFCYKCGKPILWEMPVKWRVKWE